MFNSIVHVTYGKESIGKSKQIKSLQFVKKSIWKRWNFKIESYVSHCLYVYIYWVTHK